MNETTETQENITSETISEESATTAVPSDVNAPGTTQQKKPFDPISMVFIAVLVFFVFMMFRGPRKKQQQQQKMIKSLEKNDRIRTIGGIIGTVVDVRDDEIILKIDESNNTKIRISPNAVGARLGEEKT